jgi:hypothetical protein
VARRAVRLADEEIEAAARRPGLSASWSPAIHWSNGAPSDSTGALEAGDGFRDRRARDRLAG